MRSNLPIANTSAGARSKGDWFGRLAVMTARISGKPVTFLLAVAVVIVWAVTGPIFGFSDTWQLVITTIVTFLMVFLIQATQRTLKSKSPGQGRGFKSWEREKIQYLTPAPPQLKR
jgi:type IV secretory pathway VirB2 component (pilin)